MKLVVDSNSLQSPELRTFLARSNHHVAVLTDYAAMEAYKGDTLVSIFRTMEVLEEFPQQVIVLKGTRANCTQRGRVAGLQRRLIDQDQTEGFPAYIRHLRLARQGHAGLQRQLLNLGREATLHLDRMLQDATSMGSVISDIATMYSKEERAVIRRDEIPTSATVDKVVQTVITIAGWAFGQHPDVKFKPKYAELANTFIFRAALCVYLLVLDWVVRGGAQGAAPAKLRNDFVDMYFAAYGTYFDGLLTSDKKTQRLHTKARIWLTALGCTLPNGLGYRASNVV